MQLAGTTSWRMGTDEPQSLLMALYVRDAEAAGIWIEARKREFVALSTARPRVLLESEIVRTVERGLGRTARPFELDVRGTARRFRSRMATVL